MRVHWKWVAAVTTCGVGLMVWVGLPPVLWAQSKRPAAASATSSPLVWPLPPDTPRIRFLESFSNNFDIEPRKKLSWVDRLVGKPDPNVPEYFLRPSGVAADSRDRVLIAAAQVATVFILDRQRQTVLRLRGDRGLFFKNPLGIVVDSQDNFYVADPVLRMVLKFSPEGQLLATIGPQAGLRNPTFLALDEPRRRLFLVDSHLHQVLVFDLDTLNLVRRVGQRGERVGEFNYPVGIGVARDGTFAVSDTGSCSVQVFSLAFTVQRRFGKQGTRPGDFVRPKGVAFDSEGHIYVVDAAFNNFQIFNQQGQVLLFVGSYGQQPGMFNLPLGIYIDRRDRIYVSDQLNHRVQVFQFLGGH